MTSSELNVEKAGLTPMLYSKWDQVILLPAAVSSLQHNQTLLMKSSDQILDNKFMLRNNNQP
jgi:hypothetical protein